MTVEFDPGPPRWFAEHFSRVPGYSSRREDYWYDWGPVFYRGRLDGTARLLCVASDPGPTERIAMRTLVGDAGQRVQGFLTKLGLTHSYLCLNALAYALIPSHYDSGRRFLWDPDHIRWRNELFDEVKRSNLQAIAAFGENAQVAVGLWDGKGDLPVFEVPHPSSRDPQRFLDTWREAVEGLRGVVTPDPDGDPSTPNYGNVFGEENYARVPPKDLPFGVPDWLGDDSWRRKMGPLTRSSVVRPKDDDRHTLIWYAPWS